MVKTRKAPKGQKRRGRPSADPRVDARRALKRALREQRAIATLSRQLDDAVRRADEKLFELARAVYQRNAKQVGVEDDAAVAHG